LAGASQISGLHRKLYEVWFSLVVSKYKFSQRFNLIEFCQVLVGNCGCLVEAVCLSYIHACGFPFLSNSTSDSHELSAHHDKDDSTFKRTDSLPSRSAVISHLPSRLSSDALNLVALDDKISTAPVVISQLASRLSSDSLGLDRGDPEHVIKQSSITGSSSSSCAVA